MNKPLTLEVNELEQKLINSINNSNLPVYCLKNILQDIFKQLDDIEKRDIQLYQDNLKKEESKKKKKEGEK